MKFIFKRKLKYYTKEVLKFLNITLIAFGFIIAIVLIKYKPIYEVSISGEEVGYVKNKEAFDESVKNYIDNYSAKNIDQIKLDQNPEYKLVLLDKTEETNENEVLVALQRDLKITYKYYAISLNGEIIENVDTQEQSQQIAKDFKEDSFEIIEKTTENIEEVNTNDLEIAKTNIIQKTKGILNYNGENGVIANVNGVKIASVPVSGTISSRYGVSSRIRSSNHTGLDIATTSGTPIKVIADGTVISATRSGAYGNLVKIQHENNVESWYAHTSKMYVKAGQTVTAGDVIAAVGSTGNSTGPHLHLEIRVNGEHVNPQNYLY